MTRTKSITEVMEEWALLKRQSREVIAINNNFNNCTDPEAREILRDELDDAIDGLSDILLS